jgi:hypothetical protein
VQDTLLRAWRGLSASRTAQRTGAVSALAIPDRDERLFGHAQGPPPAAATESDDPRTPTATPDSPGVGTTGSTSIPFYYGVRRFTVAAEKEKSDRDDEGDALLPGGSVPMSSIELSLDPGSGVPIYLQLVH